MHELRRLRSIFGYPLQWPPWERSDHNQSFIAQAPVAIAMFDSEMRYRAASKKWLSLYNLKLKDILGHSHYEVFPEIPERWKAVHRRCLAGSTERADEDLFILRNGTKTWATWEVRPWYLDSASTRIGGIIIFVEDVTALKMSRDEEHALRIQSEVEKALRLEAEKLNTLKDDFFATLSHELRTPLHSLIGWIQLLKIASGDAEGTKQALIAIEQSAAQMNNLVSDIMDTNRIAIGKLKLNLADISLSAIVEDVIAASLPEAAVRRIVLERGVFSEDARVKGDLTRLKQIVSNLLTNALKFTEPDGHIQVSVESCDTVVRVSVRDDGIGIAPEMQTRVFDRFSQVEQSNGNFVGGLGLGLSIVKHLVEAHLGKVWVTSAGLGQGSEFTIELPLLDQGCASAA